MEKFDFSKIEDQKKFDNLPEKEREEIIDEASEKTNVVEKKRKHLIDLLTKLRNSDINDIINLKNTLPEEIIQSKEVQQVAKEGFIKHLSAGHFSVATSIKNIFNLQEQIVQQVVKERLIKCFLREDVNQVTRIKNNFNLSEETFQQAVKEGLINFLLTTGSVNKAIEIKNIFNLSEETAQQAAKEGLINFLSWGYVAVAIQIKNIFNLSEEIIQSKEVQEAIKDKIVEFLLDGKVDAMKQTKEGFSIIIQPKEIIERVSLIKEFLDKIKPVLPQFYEQAHKSLDTLSFLFEFAKDPDKFLREIQENPFLADAVMENPKFGSKLLLKFPQLDELSKQNIQILFDTKKEIMKENPDINLESLEFRQLMQEKLKNYADNQDILEEMKRNGININKWLNYEETSYFSLESGKSKLAFSETVSTPLNRIKETINSYSHQIKEVLKEYKQELSGCQIPIENSKEIEDKIAQMREEMEKAKTEGNDRKAQGIQKGIDGLTQKLTNLKTVSSWDKILGDINAFDQLKNDVFGMQEKLIQAENEFAEKTSGKTPSGKEIQDAKQRIAKAKEELKNKFELLENRIENFKTNLPNLIEPALGKERTDSLIQEIETNLAEQFDHYNTDRSDLVNLFSEKSDKEKDKMDSQPMSIFVWARNPDIDLYQGNYSDCCIKINSDHMGAESTIADYNTDLGVQIVNIWDETKNEPVTAAWCWIGKDGKGETALVVDNIESNTLYSSNYPKQLTEQLFDYLKDYAKSIGVKKVVLGKANNDLPTGSDLAKLSNDDGKYEKIGGYNRADGYFLEAQNQSVKIIWEAKNNVVKEEKSKLETSKIEFKDINTIALSEKYFEAIKRLERKIYRDTDLIRGEAMIQDIKDSNGLDYSVIVYGLNSKTGNKEAVAYAIAIEDETDEGDNSIYLDDIAVLPEAQKQGLGWKVFKGLAEKLKAKSAKEGKSVIFDMHLREDSQRLLERHRQDLEEMGVKLIEEVLVADYYDEGEDALYQVYEIKGRA